MHFNKIQSNDERNFFAIIDLSNPAILAYSITFRNKKENAHHSYFIFDDDNAYLINNGMVVKQWDIIRISYDSSGGEIATKEGDTILVSKDISIKKVTGKVLTYECTPVDITAIDLNNHH